MINVQPHLVKRTEAGLVVHVLPGETVQANEFVMNQIALPLECQVLIETKAGWRRANVAGYQSDRAVYQGRVLNIRTPNECYELRASVSPLDRTARQKLTALPEDEFKKRQREVGGSSRPFFFVSRGRSDQITRQKASPARRLLEAISSTGSGILYLTSEELLGRFGYRRRTRSQTAEVEDELRKAGIDVVWHLQHAMLVLEAGSFARRFPNFRSIDSPQLLVQFLSDN
ncbi:MAG: hypothetical protein HONBIEJF_01043 [Fimbriimonadaceae bacterium]|nr:hypothetical protein [Fimbriimonadaceae bacterium]